MLHHKISGSGEPLVLVHGILSDMKYWQPILHDLEQKFQVIRVELIGFGGSRHIKSDYTLESQAKALSNLIQQITPDQPVTLVAHSMGSLVSAQVAATHPGLIKKLFLLNPPVNKSSQQVIDSLKKTNWLYRLALYSPFSRVLWPVVKLLSRFSNQKLFRYLTHSHSHASRQGALRLIEQTRIADILSRIDIPTVIINGRYDRPEYASNLSLIPEKPNITLIWAETGHHTVHQTPELLLDLL